MTQVETAIKEKDCAIASGGWTPLSAKRVWDIECDIYYDRFANLIIRFPFDLLPCDVIADAVRFRGQEYLTYLLPIRESTFLRMSDNLLFVCTLGLEIFYDPITCLVVIWRWCSQWVQQRFNAQDPKVCEMQNVAIACVELNRYLSFVWL